MKQETINIRVESEFCKIPTNGEIQIQSWEATERKKRALKAACVCFGLAGASAFLPIAHFVLVPGFLLAIPFVFSFISKQQNKLLGGSYLCPCCGTKMELHSQPADFPIQDTCSTCRKSVSIQMVA
ncbi:MAG: hypothetical protein COV44_07905 [Deltaproteobacteria bacterium CG11_big_fil_rev_8_21_14_0_20_45_16]|nr:MAG: hypothetical protein COV44_07905 [Deltaproteobacteria bacterium CG11_big_fil_rev_8_21_14_0_20_45_16]